MIIFLAAPQASIGSQLFQYSFVKTLQKNNEKIVLVGFEQLKTLFKNIDYINISYNYVLIKILFYVFQPLLIFLSDKKIISSVQVVHEKILIKYKRETTSFTVQKGFFKNITFVKFGYFQSEKFFNKQAIKQLDIKDKHLTQAKQYLQNIPPNAHKIFIHIYQNKCEDYQILGKTTSLPMQYFKAQIAHLQQQQANAYFIVLSNKLTFLDTQFADLFPDTKHVLISRQDCNVDFAIMSLCDSAILSPNSFGWWGSYWIKNKHTIIAPQYWLGFNAQTDYPQAPLFTGTSAVEVPISPIV